MAEEIDFFAIEPQHQYDCVVCSMVINCVPDPKKRGEMLARLYAHLIPDRYTLYLTSYHYPLTTTLYLWYIALPTSFSHPILSLLVYSHSCILTSDTHLSQQTSQQSTL